MSLKSFHIVFISLACVTSVLFGIWCLSGDEADAGQSLRVAGWVSVGVGVVLVFYGWWFLKKIKKWEQDEAAKNSPLPFDRRGPGAGGGD